MRRILVAVILAVIVITIATGCAPRRIWTSAPEVARLNEPGFAVEFTPLRNGKNFIHQFRVLITNRSDAELVVDWVATRYILEGKPFGGFIFEGVNQDNINAPPPDRIRPGETLTKIIAPARTIAWRKGPGYRDQPAFSAGPLPAGRNGIVLVLTQADREYRRPITVDITVEPR